jgi:crotonobetainyl-CoA:carnitine CoA-transferase CaiB-like acyl-CoA transferase
MDDTTNARAATMPGPMQGVKVLEVAAWIAAPAASGILADWGAEVIKVEPCNGDPFRGIVTLGSAGINPAFELDNRGKRGMAMDVNTPQGHELLLELISHSDVFITNLRPSTLEDWRIDPATLLELFPALVYGNVTGFGHDGPHRDRPSYDIGGFWARSGGAAAHTVDGQAPPTLRGAYGDHMTAMSLAGGIAAALFERGRTGRGRHVTTSLVRTGVYSVGQDTNVMLRAGITFPMGSPREVAGNPMLNCYRASDGRWFWLLGLQPDRHWPTVLGAVDRLDLLSDPRFASLAERRAHSAELVAELDTAFATRPRDEWEAIFAEHGVWYEPVLSIGETVVDPIVVGSGAFVEVPGPDGPMPAVATPVDFPGSPIDPLRPPPRLGEHTDEILLELGHDWDTIIEWKAGGVVL